MKRNTSNQNGFATVEAGLIVVIIAIIAGTGYYVYHASTKSSDTINQGSLASQTATATQTQKALAATKTQVASAVEAYPVASGTQPTTVNVQSVISSNAKGNFGSGSNLTDFVAHKANGTWTVVYEGSKIPGKDVGNKYNLPTTWYSTAN